MSVVLSGLDSSADADAIDDVLSDVVPVMSINCRGSSDTSAYVTVPLNKDESIGWPANISCVNPW